MPSGGLPFLIFVWGEEGYTSMFLQEEQTIQDAVQLYADEFYDGDVSEIGKVTYEGKSIHRSWTIAFAGLTDGDTIELEPPKPKKRCAPCSVM